MLPVQIVALAFSHAAKLRINSCGYETSFLTKLFPNAVVHATPQAGAYSVGNVQTTFHSPFCRQLNAAVCGEDRDYCKRVQSKYPRVWGPSVFPYALVIFYNRGYDNGMPPAVPPVVKGVAYVQLNCVRHREAAAAALSDHVDVFAFGKCRGFGTRIQRRTFPGYFTRLGSDPQSPYRTHAFALTMEHANQRGYCTEKALLAAAGGAIPIYDGDPPSLCKLLNCDRVLFWNATTPRVVAALLADESLYAKMWRLPRINAGKAREALLAAQRAVRL